MRSNSFDVYVIWFGWVEKQAETFVRNDLGTSCGPKPPCAAKVIGVAVRNDDGMNAAYWHTNFTKTLVDCGPCCLARKAGVDNRDASTVFQNIHIDVPEPRKVDG
jgi:hypothetical protein